jgi:hypothetical protein
MKYLDTARLTDIEMGNVDSRDYPDFCDAYVEYAEFNGRVLTEDELEYVNENRRELVNEMAHEHFI